MSVYIAKYMLIVLTSYKYLILLPVPTVCLKEYFVKECFEYTQTESFPTVCNLLKMSGSTKNIPT